VVSYDRNGAVPIEEVFDTARELDL
jgi:hypothetical protein